MTILRRRRGITSVMAVLYLVLFSSLAVGFYAATTFSAQIVKNERVIAHALVAAESGMEFTRYHLAQVTVPHGTPETELLDAVEEQLRERIDGTGNIGGGEIARLGDTILIPGDPSAYITVNDVGSSFRARIRYIGEEDLEVKIIGRYGGVQIPRAVQMDFDLAYKASNIFDYGIASRGKVRTEGVARIVGAKDPKKGSILSTSMTDPTPVEILGKEISGDISIVNPDGNVVVGPGVSIGGTADPAKIQEHIHKGVQEPEFPTIDTDIFKAYATNTYTGGNVLNNMVIPANTNPTFAAGVTITGVVYVEMPNKIDFRGATNIHGVIVVENNPPGTLLSNVIDFRGNITSASVDTLPREQYGGLVDLTGAFLLAPNTHVRFSGNFGEINGAVIASKVTFDGNATGTIKGSVINLDDTQMLVKGSSTITIASTGTFNFPAGVYFSRTYAPLPDTYEEVKP